MDVNQIVNLIQEPGVRVALGEVVSFVVKRTREKFSANPDTQARSDKALDGMFTLLQEELRQQGETISDIQSRLSEALTSPRGAMNLERDMDIGAITEDPFTQAALARLVAKRLTDAGAGPSQGLYRHMTDSLEFLGERQLRALAALSVVSGRFILPGAGSVEERTQIVIGYFVSESAVLSTPFTIPDLSLLSSLGLCSFDAIRNSLERTFTANEYAPALDKFLASDGFGTILAKRYEILSSYNTTVSGLILGTIVLDLIHGRKTDMHGLD